MGDDELFLSISYTKITNNLRHTIFKANNEVGVSNVPVFCYAEIHNVDVNESPNWLKTRLRQNNLEPDNLFTDLTNYSLIEWGQPISFYDLDEISDTINKQELNIRSLKDKKTFTDQNNNKYTIKPTHPYLTLNDNPISLLGITGEQKGQVTKKTKNIILEAAIYPQAQVRKIMREVGIGTKLGFQFAKGVPLEQLGYAFQRILKLITLHQQTQNIKIYPYFWKIKRHNNNSKITLNYEIIQKTLGNIKTKEGQRQLTEKEINGALKQLNFDIHKNNQNFEVEIPKNSIKRQKSDSTYVVFNKK